MRKFLIKLLLSLIPFLSLYPIDLVYSQIAMRSNYPPIEMWYDLMHGKIDSDVVAFGNSRTHRHINPSIVDSILQTNSFNCGMTGGTINRSN